MQWVFNVPADQQISQKLLQITNDEDYSFPHY